MNALRVLALAHEQEELLHGLDELLHELDLPIRLDRVNGIHRALEELRAKPVDAIVCVVERPDELAVIVRLRKHSPDTPILLLTNDHDSEAARLGRALGATEVLERSSTRETFAKTLRQIFETRRIVREQRTQVDRTLLLSQDIAALAGEANRLAESASRQLGGGSRLAKFSPILVEDDPDQVFLMLRAFGKAGLPGPVQVLNDGEEAIRYLSGKDPYHDRRRHPLPSLAILDLKMPKKTGLEVLEWIRGSPHLAELPVVILSTSTAPEDFDRARRLGANLYLVKPLGLEGLVQLVRAIVGFWVISQSGADSC